MLLHQGTHEPSRLASCKSKHVSEEASTDFSQAPFCSFPVFECLLSQRCWSRHSRRYVLWHRVLLARSTSNPKQLLPKMTLSTYDNCEATEACFRVAYFATFYSLPLTFLQEVSQSRIWVRRLCRPAEHIPWSWERIGSVQQLCLISGGFPNLGLYGASNQVFNKRHFYINERKTKVNC